ncbi:hypothetical protein F5144DRAFT_336571 [Chaetomium tenue]|uniref:Uncharacterized protein n=1 Tax=Chaetomium tenue TaxID=1854479 RepID=A0ACB7P230_9PEZI|nr:hypothetical protein F5144DRAFT_336571 [Chaetomium globosum]
MALPPRLRAIPRHFSISPLQRHITHPSQSPSSLSSIPPTQQSQTRRFTQNLTHTLQIYRSASTDPYLNLSIEHHLLQRSHPDSTILFLYTNRPSIIIGRNQNPWLEVNLHALREGLPPQTSPPPPPHTTPTTNDAHPSPRTTTATVPVPIALVRRRSGGGTVFHDAGNTNYSVICPPAAFDRDRHAEMVVRALRGLGVGGARVNERHDIVVDVGDGGGGEGAGGTFKVSGSAYKLTRTRSLHHGTCLLGSENLGRVSRLLRSPAEGFVKARGVESVRSPIRNVGVGGEEFVDAVMGEFRKMYGDAAGQGVVVGEDEALANEEVVKGVRELVSPDWIFGQTPQFTFSTHPTEEDPRERPEVVHTLPYGFETHFSIRHGEIQSATMAGLEYHDFVDEASQDEILSKGLVKQRLHYITDWRRTLKQASPIPVDVDDAGEFLNHMFGIQPPAEKGGGAVAQAVVQTISDTVVGMFLDGDIMDL